MDYKLIGRRVQRARKSMNLTQEQLSAMADISLSFLGHIERGARIMSIETLKKLAQVLKCSTDYLLGVEEISRPVYEQALDKIRGWIDEELNRIDAEA